MRLLPNHIVWPEDVLSPNSLQANIVPFSRIGGRTLTARAKTTRTDRGFWRVELSGIHLGSSHERRAWQAIRSTLAGRAGLIAVPVWSFDSAPYLNGCIENRVCTPFSQGECFEDGSSFEDASICVQTVDDIPLGATVCRLRLINGEADLSGVRFSYGNALYETGQLLDLEDDIFTVRLAISCRAPIPAGVELEFDRPTCLCRLADDSAMDLALSHHGNDIVSVAFTEAVDFWSDFAAGLT